MMARRFRELQQRLQVRDDLPELHLLIIRFQPFRQLFQPLYEQGKVRTAFGVIAVSFQAQGGPYH